MVDRAETDPGGASVQVIDRAVDLLRTIARSDHPLTAPELARVTGLNRSTAWRILNTLERHGAVERDTDTGTRYVLGLLLGDLASQSRHDALVRRARPVLEGLVETSGELISLAVPQRLGIVYVDFLGPQVTRVPDWLQSSPERLYRAGPVHATSAGKVFLAWLSPDEQDAVLPAVLPRYTGATVADRAALAADLAAVRRQRYATAFGEHEEYTSAVSAPVLSESDRLVAIVNLFGPRQRLTRARLRALGAELRTAGVEIAGRLGS